jgi:IS5 family transposase
MAGLSILKHTYDLSDEQVCDRFLENPYFQYFCGEEFFQHDLPLERSSLTRWRQRMGAERLNALLQESLAAASKTRAIKPSDLACVIIDTTVQEKNITFPTDAKLFNRAREKLVKLAKIKGVRLRQSYARVGKFALIKHQRYAHAKQFKRANRALRKLKTYLGRVIRDISRKIEGNPYLETVFARPLARGRRVRAQERGQRRPKVYSLHAPGGTHRQHPRKGNDRCRLSRSQSTGRHDGGSWPSSAVTQQCHRTEPGVGHGLDARRAVRWATTAVLRHVESGLPRHAGLSIGDGHGGHRCA